jgi:hypothetical protein
MALTSRGQVEAVTPGWPLIFSLSQHAFSLIRFLFVLVLTLTDQKIGASLAYPWCQKATNDRRSLGDKPPRKQKE